MTRPLMRRLKWLLIAVLALMLGLSALAASLVATERGSRWLLQQLAQQVPGLEVQGIHGRLLDRVALDRLNYSSPGLSVEVTGAQLEWEPLALLQRRVQVKALDVERIELRPGEVEDQPGPDSGGGLNLPERIGLPLELTLERLAIATLQIGGDDQTRSLQAIELSLSTRAGRLQLNQLALQAPQGQVAVTGQVRLGGRYEVDLATQARLTLPQRPALDLSGTLSGPLDALQLRQTLSGGLDGSVRATLEGLVTEQPSWQLALDLARLEPQRWLAQADTGGLEQLSARLTAAGDLSHARLALNASASGPEVPALELDLRGHLDRQRLSIEQLELTQRDSDLRLSGQGELSALEHAPQLALDAHWQALRWPLSAAGARVTSPRGSLSMTGPLAQLRVTLQGLLQGAEIPALKLHASGVAAGDRIENLAVAVQTLGGQLSAAGGVRWQPELTWDLKVEGDAFDPGRFWPQWPGRVGAALHTSGALTPGQPDTLDARIRLDALSGTLREQSLSGQGQLRYRADQLSVEQLALGWGAARLRAQGEIADSVQLDWQLQIPALEQLLPQAAGRLSAEGRLHGPRTLPQVSATLDARGVQGPSLAVERAQADIRFDPQGGEPTDIALSARGISWGGRSLERLALETQGVLSALTTRLELSAAQGELSLASSGALVVNDAHWRYAGELSEWLLEGPISGRWSLTDAVPLTLAADGVRLERTCLRAEAHAGRLCAAVSAGSTGDLQGELQLVGAPLTLLEPWLPPGVVLDGRIDADATLNRHDQRLDYALDLTLPRARVSSADAELVLNLDAAQLALEGSDRQASATLTAPLNRLGGRIDGQLRLTDLGAAQRMNGTLELALPDLRPFAVLSPAIAIERGSAEARFTLGGTLSAPALQGRVALNDGIVELPAAGIRLQALQATLRDDPDAPGELLLAAGADSGEGRLALQGRLLPFERRVRLEITGERFEAVKTPAIHLLLSPQVQVDAGPEQVQVRGEISVPEALIQPPPRSAAVPAPSPDLVIVNADDGAAPARGPLTDVELRIQFGDQVRVDAFGFNGLLDGSLKLQQSGRGVARGSGRVGVQQGEYRIYGQNLQISRGSVLFTGGPLTNPGLDLRVERVVEDVRAGAVVTGTLRAPELTLTSTPSMPDNRILSYLLLGRAPGTASAGEQELMMRLAMSLATRGGNRLTEQLQGALNVDELGFAAGDAAADTEFYIGKYLTPDLYIKYGIGLVEPVSTFLMRYRLSEGWSLETETSAQSSGGDLIYSFER